MLGPCRYALAHIVTNASLLAFLPQMVPDLDPPTKRQHWHRTPGAATGSEECRPLGKGFRHPCIESYALGPSVYQALPRP